MKKVFYRLYSIFFKWSVMFVHYVYNRKSQDYYQFFLSKNGVKFNGKAKYIGLTSTFDNHGIITINSNVVISEEVVFLTHDYSPVNPNKEFNSITCGYPWIGDISIGENSFIGIRVLILPGTKIGKNCIVGAGAVIKGDIPDNSIVAGNPAKIICKTSDWIKKKNLLNIQKPIYGSFSMLKIK